MTDEELARIESWAAMIPEIETSWAAAIVQQDIHALIAEVRRLKAENRAMQSKLDLAEGRFEVEGRVEA